MIVPTSVPTSVPPTDADADASTDPLKEIRECWKEAEEYWSDNRRSALDDIKFAAGDHWPEKIVAQREKDHRPCLTVDKLNQYVRQIVNDGRQNRPSIKVRPVDSGADVATAEIYQGLVKHIEQRSNADAAYDCALSCSATNGFGFFRILSEYARDDTFDQELCIRRIRNPLSVMVDPAAQEADGSDMKFAFVTESISKADFEAEWPDKIPEDFESNDAYSDWYGDEVRIAEYWCVKEDKRTRYLLEDGTVISQAEFDALTAAGAVPEVRETRNIPKRTVWHAKVSGKEFLEPLTEWPGRYIPILVVWGNEIDIEGKVLLSGIIRPAKDAQRLYDYSRSAFAERVALTPKAPWVAAEGQVEDYAEDWNTANVANHSVLRYRPTSLNGTPIPPPQRTNAADIPAGFAQDMQISEHDIQGAIGMYSSSVGAPSNERSGKAIMARQKEGDVGTFHYHDNLARAISHAGRILVDLIPKIYDSNRVVRILGYDGSSDSATIDPTAPSASQKQGLTTVYNLGVGTYDVTVTTGPSYNTMRQEAAESMANMVQANPELMGVIGDIMVKSMDWPGAEQMAERLKLMLAPQVLEAERNKKDMSPEVQQIQAAFDQQMAEKDQMMQELQAALQEGQQKWQAADLAVKNKESEASIKMREADIKAAELRIKQAELEVTREEVRVKWYEAETDRLVAHAKAQDAEDRLVLDAGEAEERLALDTKQGEEAKEAKAALGAPASSVTPAESSSPPINITIDGSRPVQKKAKATRQADGSYVMESIETPL